MINYMKKHLFTEMGDKADNWIDQMFLESSEFNFKNLRNINITFWEETEVYLNSIGYQRIQTSNSSLNLYPLNI